MSLRIPITDPRTRGLQWRLDFLSLRRRKADKSSRADLPVSRNSRTIRIVPGPNVGDLQNVAFGKFGTELRMPANGAGRALVTPLSRGGAIHFSEIQEQDPIS